MAFLQQTVRNRLLKALPADDFNLLEPSLQPMPAPLRHVMFEAHKPIEHVYFPESGFASVTMPSTTGPIELGMIGREGLVGASPILLGVDRSPHDCFTQMAGDVLRISVADLKQAIGRSPGLGAVLLRFVQSFLVQIAQTAFANAAYTIEIRLARWLLMCHDRGQDDELGVTHEFLAMMLGVRRPGVTLATQTLEGNLLIRASRGRIVVLDRPGLEALAGESYGIAEAEYLRLIERAP